MLYLLRHGQTDWNKAHKLQGTTDIPLNETGRQMAKDAVEKVRNVDFDICYCSPLSRARETADIFLSGRDVPLICDDRLKEISFGKYEGSTEYFTDPTNPIYPLFHDPENYDCRGEMESFDELAERTRSFIDEIIAPLTAQGKKVLIVAHGAMNLSIYNQIYDIPRRNFWDNLMKNCELCAIEDEDIRRYVSR